MTLWKKKNSGKPTQVQKDVSDEFKLEMLKWMIHSTPDEQTEVMTVIGIMKETTGFNAMRCIAQLLNEFRVDCGWSYEQLGQWLKGEDANAKCDGE